MSYCEFIDTIRFCRLTLRYPGLWQDKLESLFLKSFESDDKINKLAKIYEEKYPSYSIYDIKSDFQIISSLLIKTRCQCWTYKEDDIIMWNERNSNLSVRIGVPVCCFDKYEKNSEKRRLIHRDVNYLPKVNISTLLDCFVKDRVITELVLTKKMVFMYEDEHRLILLPENHSFSTPTYGNTLSECLRRHFYGTKDEFGLLDEHFAFDIKDIINVKVNPNATDDFAKLVQMDCEQFGINYSGISTILL